MGYIREPEGVDLFINSGPLTEADEAAISQYIREWKEKNLPKSTKVAARKPARKKAVVRPAG